MGRIDGKRIAQGIWKIPGGFRIRVRAVNPRTGKLAARERIELGITLPQAKRIRDDLKHEILSGGERASRARLGDYARSWLEGKAAVLRASTLKRYASTLEDHVLPTLGDLYVDAITPADCVAWRERMTRRTYEVRDGLDDDGKPKTKRVKYEPSAINSWLRVLRTVLADAFSELRLGESPAARLRALPEPPVYTDENPNTLTADELGAVIVELRKVSPSFFPLLATEAITGLRASEATALKWADLIEGDTVLWVRRSHVRGDVVDDTKTGRERRVPVPTMLRDILRSHLAELVRVQHDGLDDGWMFPSDKGTPRYDTTLAKPLRKALTAAKISKRFTPHGFRRTLNNLLRSVATADVQKAITGHSTEAMREHYSHVAIGEKARAIDNVVALFGKE